MVVGARLPSPREHDQARPHKRQRTGLKDPRDKSKGVRQLQLYFANVTSWSASASDYLKDGSPLSNSDVMCVAEHHINKGQRCISSVRPSRNMDGRSVLSQRSVLEPPW